MSDLLTSLSYQEAKTQLEKIIENLESGNTDIDQLENTISRASDLVRFCQNRLRQTEETLKDSSNKST